MNLVIDAEDMRTVVRVVEDDRGMATALERLIRSTGRDVECHRCGEDLLEALDPATPGCILLDVRLPGAGGFSVFSALLERGILVPVIFITGYPDVRTAIRAIRSGAVDFIEKPFEAADVLEAVEHAVGLDTKIRREQAERAAIEARIARLTRREREVLALMLRGRLNKQIAHDLGISQRTVEVHRYRIMKKMQADSIVDLLGLAFRAADECLPDLFRPRLLPMRPKARGRRTATEPARPTRMAGVRGLE